VFRARAEMIFSAQTVAPPALPAGRWQRNQSQFPSTDSLGSMIALLATPIQTRWS